MIVLFLNLAIQAKKQIHKDVAAKVQGDSTSRDQDAFPISELYCSVGKHYFTIRNDAGIRTLPHLVCWQEVIHLDCISYVLSNYCFYIACTAFPIVLSAIGCQPPANWSRAAIFPDFHSTLTPVT